MRPWARARFATECRADRCRRGSPEGDHGRFTNERRLSDRDKATLTAWVAGGAAQGNQKDLPPVPQFATGWQIGKPDAVFEMPESFSILASGTIEYQLHEVPTHFTEDRWIQAAECDPAIRSMCTT